MGKWGERRRGYDCHALLIYLKYGTEKEAFQVKSSSIFDGHFWSIFHREDFGCRDLGKRD